MKKITKGMAIIKEPAAKVVKSFFLSVTKLNKPKASVCLLTERKTIFGKTKSIQGPVNVVIPKKVMMGLATGITIVAQILKWLAPSMRAASSKLLGIVSM